MAAKRGYLKIYPIVISLIQKPAVFNVGVKNLRWRSFQGYLIEVPFVQEVMCRLKIRPWFVKFVVLEPLTFAVVVAGSVTFGGPNPVRLVSGRPV